MYCNFHSDDFSFWETQSIQKWDQFTNQLNNNIDDNIMKSIL